jgi:hypothetical protein
MSTYDGDAILELSVQNGFPLIDDVVGLFIRAVYSYYEDNGDVCEYYTVHQIVQTRYGGPVMQSNIVLKKSTNLTELISDVEAVVEELEREVQARTSLLL